ncbi:zinc-dependent alcohol dehydrogenase [Thermoactinospora rubra]|uniref:zinc-dependent alcohol dehydrogenase n=1 Tax=Thermoactinospora rubra TaxID=1088767 RepID=UPI000A0FD445|nr:alcohol dehydrogenase catalytic domain-containing protein [Thermoactinospora rubra]
MSVPALVWNGGHDVVVREEPRPAVPDGWALVDVAYCGLCGTDLHICAGEHPRAKPGIVIGHEISGTVHADAAGLPAGTKVVVDPLLPCGRCGPCRNGRPHTCASLRLIGIDAPGGAARQVAVPADRLIPVPPTADLRHLAFAEPLAVAVRAVRQSGLRLGQTVIVAGAGPVGLAVALCARRAGAGDVVVAEPSPLRRGLAAELGFESVESFGDLSADVFFDAAAHPAVAAGMTAATAPAGRIVLVGVYGTPAAVDLQAVTFKEITLIGTRVYSRDDIRTATEMICAGQVDPEPFLTGTVPLEEAAGAIADLRAGRQVKVLVRGAS